MIRASDLTKRFTIRRRTGRMRTQRTVVDAVDRVSVTVEAGEMLGYIGPNGAGKSTTIKMCVGILVPTGGTIRVAGLDPSRRRIDLARRIGVVFGQRTQLWWDLPLRDSFELLRYIYRVDAARHRRNLDAFVELLDMQAFLDTPVRQLSLGQRMRGDLAAALLHDPDILFLDEPTIGLDVVAKARIRDFLQTINGERGVTILLTTHDVSDIERLCRRVLVIDRGHVIYDGALAALVERFGGERTLVIDLEEPAPPLVVEGARVVRVDGPRQWLRFARSDASAARLVAEVASRVRLVDLAIEEPDIEDVVRRIYQRDAGDPSL